MGLLIISSAVMTMIGLVVYKRYFFKLSWRWIYIVTTSLGVVFSILQLLLIYRVNVSMGIGDSVFALGDNTFAAFVQSVQFMPTCIMYAALCPDGAEGTTYALLTTISNLAGTVGGDFSSWIAGIWDTSNDTLKAGNYDGLVNVTILTSLLQLAPIALVFLLPASKDEQIEMRKSGKSSVVVRSIFIYLS
jgi:hypothetical protein